MKNNNVNNQLGFLDLIGLGSTGLGIYNTILNQQQISNDELFTKLVSELKKDIKEDNDRIFEEIRKEIHNGKN